MLKRAIIGATVLILGACGQQTAEEKRATLSTDEKNSSESTAEGALVFSAGGDATFSLDAPDSLKEDRSSQEIIAPPLPPVEKPSGRISISCKVYPQAADATEDKIAPAYATLVVNLEEYSGDAIGVERAKFPYNCNAGAMITLASLDTGRRYKVAAQFYNARGQLAYEGSTPNFAPGTSTSVRLVMKKVIVEPPKTDVNVDVVFEDEPQECTMTTLCPKIYAPVVCIGTIQLSNGQETKRKVEAGNECTAKAELHFQACKLGGKLIDLSCKPQTIETQPKPFPAPMPLPAPEPLPEATTN